jgi:hypothetical protein
MKVQPTTKELIAMLYERLPELFDRAAPVQEPVDSMGMPLSCRKPLCAPGDHHPLCKLAKPPAAQRTWVGLTDDEIIDVIHPLVMADMPEQATDYEIARAIEAKLKEKNA